MIKSLRKIKFMTAVVFFAAAFCVYSEISFENPNLNSQDKLLFSINHDFSGTPSYSTVFLGDAKTLSDTKILTCYPEKMEVLSKGAVLQIRNKWGTARYNVYDNTLAWISRADRIPSLSQNLLPQNVSPDGKWICYVKKDGISKGKLILKNASTLQETVLNQNANLDYERVPVLWNPDSTSVLYEKDGTIYFCDPKAAFQKIQLTEEYRKIGKGSINSVYWANSKSLFYVDRDLVYLISSNELYTRGLYSDVVGAGTVVGRLPVKFDSIHDSFTVSSKNSSLVLVQGKNIINMYKLADRGFEYLSPIFAKNITDIDGTVNDIKVFWIGESKCLLWISALGFNDGIQNTYIYNLASQMTFIQSFKEAGDPQISVDGKKIAFSHNKSLYVYDINLWKKLYQWDGEDYISYIWGSNNTIFAGGKSVTRVFNFDEQSEKTSSKIILLSASKNAFWNSETAICAEDPVTKGVFYDYDMTSGRWSKNQAKSVVSEGTVQNGKYRVFAGNTPNKKFKNSLYVRTLSGKAVTRAYFPESVVKADSAKKIHLAIDAIDDAQGLSRIISVLKKYDIPATFFVNGEFIRRYPKETRQIVKSGFECGAMFFTNADLTSKGFIVDENFIRRGLARNEDEFFQTTETELSLIWHTPFYKSNQNIKTAGTNCGYKYVEAGRFSLDTITLEDAAAGKSGYLSAGELVNFYVENSTDGSVIPVCTGLSKGSRSDYLYEKLDLLIVSLLNAGFEFEKISL